MSTFIPFHRQDCELLPNQIDIWQFNLDANIKTAKNILDFNQQQRADRFHFSHHRQRFIIAHAMVRIILAKYLKKNPRQLTFLYHSHGKPALQDTSNVEFNLSHSKNLALLAVGLNQPMGIDVEFFSARSYEGIGKHIFSEQELHSLQELPLSLKPLGFFNLWTQKEALIKACGLGLSYPTKEFNVPIFPATRETISDPLHHKIWQMLSFTPQAACHASLCMEKNINAVRYTKVYSVENFIKEVL